MVAIFDISDQQVGQDGFVERDGPKKGEPVCSSMFEIIMDMTNDFKSIDEMKSYITQDGRGFNFRHSILSHIKRVKAKYAVRYVDRPGIPACARTFAKCMIEDIKTPCWLFYTKKDAASWAAGL